MAVLDVREHDHEDVLRRVEHVFDLRLDLSSAVYGESGATEGFLVCANAIRVAARRGKPTPLSEPAKAAAQVLLTELQA